MSSKMMGELRVDISSITIPGTKTHTTSNFTSTELATQPAMYFPHDIILTCNNYTNDNNTHSSMIDISIDNDPSTSRNSNGDYGPPIDIEGLSGSRIVLKEVNLDMRRTIFRLFFMVCEFF